MDRQDRPGKRPDERICREHVWYLRMIIIRRRARRDSISKGDKPPSRQQTRKRRMGTYCSDWGDCGQPYRIRQRDCGSDRFRGTGDRKGQAKGRGSSYP